MGKLTTNFIFFSVVAITFYTKEASAAGYTYLGHLGHALSIPEHVLTFIFSSILLVVISVFYRIKISKVSNPVLKDSGFTFRNLMETYGEFIRNQAQMVMGPQLADRYFSFLSTLFLVLVFNNMLGLIPGFVPPTDNLNTTLAFGVVVFVFYNAMGAKHQGILNYLKHFAGPVSYLAILIFPIEIVSNFVRPLSLALRLRGNMFGDHLVLGVFSGLVPYVVPVVFLFLGTLVSFIQAFVFTMLTMVYIGMACETHDHDHGHDENSEPNHT